MTRQNYYKQRHEQRERRVDEELIVALVHRERCLQPRLGGRKLYRILKTELREAGVVVGRDRFFRVLRSYQLLVEPLPPRAHRTTNSRHSLPVFRNLAAGLEVTQPNQLWVSDITYLRTLEGYEYLALIMDLYSRKIVGYHCGKDIDTTASIVALRAALASLPEGRHPIHHSDRGCQYCSHEYVELLQSRKLGISMTEENHCYENAHAERLNGILKQEYALGGTFATRAQARQAVHQAVWLYNNRRPHGSLGDRTPAKVYSEAA